MSDNGANVPNVEEPPDLVHGRGDPSRARFGRWGPDNIDKEMTLQTFEQGTIEVTRPSPSSYPRVVVFVVSSPP
eukprot:9480194-Pyramimonas_sp.AAC.2